MTARLVIYSRRGSWIINFVQTDLKCGKGTYHLGAQGSALANNNDHKKHGSNFYSVWRPRFRCLCELTLFLRSQ